MTVYLQYRLGNQIVRIALTKNAHPLKNADERVTGKATYIAQLEGKKKALQIITDTEPLNQAAALDTEILGEGASSQAPAAEEDLGNLFDEDRVMIQALEDGTDKHAGT